MKTLSVMEGDSVTLHADVSDIQGDITVIEWMFGAENTDTVIAEINRAANINTVDERFRDRGQMDIQTGSLTITNIRTTDSGLYKLDITGTNTGVVKTFRVTVYAFLPVPVIIRNTSQSSSSSESSSVSKCVLQCSVVNVSHVTLSWYRGLSLLSSISASDLSISLSLPLEVEYQDKNTYSCVINNPISNQTKHLDITKLCQSGLSLLSSISASDLSISLSLPLEVEYQDKNTYSCVLNNPISNQTTHLDITKLCQSGKLVRIQLWADNRKDSI
ncbi:unnamed protein product [Leuciscus chuanchicus]